MADQTPASAQNVKALYQKIKGLFAPKSHTHTASEIGAAASTHYHNADAINAGTLPITRGGTGAGTAADARSALGAAASDHTHAMGDISGTLPISKGGTGATTAANARSALGAAASSHTHSNATQSAAGFMSAADKTKLDGISGGVGEFTEVITGPKTFSNGISIEGFNDGDIKFYVNVGDKFINIFMTVAADGHMIKVRAPSGYTFVPNYGSNRILYAEIRDQVVTFRSYSSEIQSDNSVGFTIYAGTSRYLVLFLEITPLS